MKFDPEVNPILEKISSIVSADETRDFAFEKGAEFYAKQKFFEAHEIFEFQWRKESGNMKLFQQALIQIAISMNKVFVNINLVGAKSQAEKAKSKLECLTSDLFFTENGLQFANNLIENLSELIQILNSENPVLTNYKEIVLPKDWASLVRLNILP